MAIINDDFNAVESTQVAAVKKPDVPELWRLDLWLLSGVAMSCSFASTDARDGFYKTLVDAMGQD